MSTVKREHQCQMQDQEKRLAQTWEREKESQWTVRLQEAQTAFEMKMQERLEAISNIDNYNIKEYKGQFIILEQEIAYGLREVEELTRQVRLREERVQELETDIQSVQEKYRVKEGELLDEKKRMSSLEMQWDDTKRYLENMLQKQHHDLEA